MRTLHQARENLLEREPDRAGSVGVVQGGDAAVGDGVVGLGGGAADGSWTGAGNEGIGVGNDGDGGAEPEETGAATGGDEEGEEAMEKGQVVGCGVGKEDMGG